MEDLNSLKKDYKKLHLSMRIDKLGRHQNSNEKKSRGKDLNGPMKEKTSRC